MSELKIGKIILGMCQTNCYYLYREGESKVIFVDPAENGKYIYDMLQKKGLEIEAIILTHGHFDHIMGAEELRKLSEVKVYAPMEDKVLLNNPDINYSSQWAYSYSMEADEYYRDGDELVFGDISCKVLYTPGHTIGSSCLYFENDKILLSGDTLFAESVGRTDLPTGSMSKLVRSVRDVLFVLPDDVKVYPGHGPDTSIGHEKEWNTCV